MHVLYVTYYVYVCNMFNVHSEAEEKAAPTPLVVGWGVWAGEEDMAAALFARGFTWFSRKKDVGPGWV